MKKWGKRLGIVIGVLVVVVFIALGAAYGASRSKQGREFPAVTGATFDIPTDAASIAEGERLFVSRGCGSADCHSANAGGHVMMQDGPLGTIAAANLTTCAVGFDAPAWDRAIRHGLNAQHRSLIFMPSADFQRMGDRELGMIVAYIRSLPRVEGAQPPCSLSMLARVVDLAGGFVGFPATVIDHAQVGHDTAAPGRTVEYGSYLARLCTGCHGEHFSGGPIPGAPPELGNPRNITPTGLHGWTEEQFRRVLREGVRPGGEHISERQMPYPALARMTDDEIGALWLYLQTVPGRPDGQR